MYMPSYRLVNPVILGSFDQEYNADTPLEAGSMFWDKLTNGKYLVNSLPKFHFTMNGGNKLHHYSVKEEILDDKKTARWNISEMPLELTNKQEDMFMKEVEKAKNPMGQSGGKRKTKKSKKTRQQQRHRYEKKNEDDSSSSSSSSSSSISDDSSSDSDEDTVLNNILTRRMRDPISYWWYTPSIYRLKRNYINYPPVFIAPNRPYIAEYWIPM